MPDLEREKFIRPELTLGRFVIVFLLIMIAWTAWFSWTRPPSGYCPSTKQYISDAEMFASAVAHQARNVRGLPENPTASDIEAFIEKNPDCCVVMRQGPFNDGMLDRLFSSGKWIQVLYELKPERIRRGQPNVVAYEATMNINACGHARDFSGIPITRDEMLSSIRANKSVK